MALAGLRPVVAIYSTFLSRSFDQQNLDVGLHRAPVVICADRAGITGDDGPSHHGLLDMVQALSIPGMALFAPSEPAEVAPMLEAALSLGAPAVIRYPKTAGPVGLAPLGSGLSYRELRRGAGEVVILGIGKMAERAMNAASLLVADGADVTVLDPRVIRPVDKALLDRVVGARLVVTAEDGMAHGGAGQYLRTEIEGAAEAKGVVPPRLVTLGVPTEFVAHGSADAILSQLGLDADGIASSVARALARLDDQSPALFSDSSSVLETERSVVKR
jgi:1-deoxy-D-xylulose-5-phosphate synthase